MKCLVCSNNKKFKKLYPEICQTKNVLCLQCGLVFIPERSDSLKQYYKQDGYFKSSPNVAYKKIFFSKSLLLEISKQRIENALKILLVNFKKKKVLDIGCGYGEILYYLKETYHVKVAGIEASAETAKFGSKIFNIPILAGILEELNLKTKFDIIHCAHTLEHINNPNEFLKKIKKLLKKNGLLYIEVPNILKPTGGFDLGTFLYNEHLQTFSVYNLWLLLKKNKFNVIAFSDENFLKFWCGNGKNFKPETISSEEVLSFLKNYNKNYNFINYLKVYYQKLQYGIRFIIHKSYDLIH